MFHIGNICISVPLRSAEIDISARWLPKSLTIAGGNGHGNECNRLSYPQGLYFHDDDQTVYIADCSNHRILGWKIGANNGKCVAGGNGPGKGNDQLNHPTRDGPLRTFLAPAPVQLRVIINRSTPLRSGFRGLISSSAPSSLSYSEFRSDSTPAHLLLESAPLQLRSSSFIAKNCF